MEGQIPESLTFSFGAFPVPILAWITTSDFKKEHHGWSSPEVGDPLAHSIFHMPILCDLFWTWSCPYWLAAAQRAIFVLEGHPPFEMKELCIQSKKWKLGASIIDMVSLLFNWRFWIQAWPFLFNCCIPWCIIRGLSSWLSQSGKIFSRGCKLGPEKCLYGSFWRSSQYDPSLITILSLICWL